MPRFALFPLTCVAIGALAVQLAWGSSPHARLGSSSYGEARRSAYGAKATGSVANLRAAQGVSPSPDRALTLTLESLMSPAAAESSAPQLTTTGERAILSWMERAGSRATLKFAERTTSGWSAPRQVVSGDDLVVNAVDVPSVLALSDGSLAAQWIQENGPDPEAYNLKLAWSKDDGATWSQPTSPHHDGTITQHGFASLFQAPGAGLGLVWLDGRATDPDSPNPSDNMALRGTTYSRDGKQLRETSIDSRVCECCPTSVAITAEGPIVAFRNRSTDEVRDIYLSRLVGGRWSTPVPVHKDNWAIDACPVNGPAVSARGRDVVVAWFTALKDEGKVFAAFSSDAGRTFGPPVRVDDVMATGHVDLELLKDGSAAVSWIEFANQRSQLRVRRLERSGIRSAAITVAGAAEGRPAGNPRMAYGRHELLFAWTETSAGASRIRTARAAVSLPAASGKP
jgi:hypothetical protein